jgi:AraC-like DNA-binding protein
MEPDLEVVQIRRDESFKAWAHGYPFRTVRWHFHPEYELHHVVATHGRYFVGDFIGEFQPGNLVLTGPNLPHNWISDLPEGATVPLRCRIVQFSEEFIGQTMALLPELAGLSAVLQKSQHGARFSSQTAKEVGPRLEALVEATGAKRIELFMGILDILVRAKTVTTLTSSDYLPDPSGYMSGGLNTVLAYIREHLTEPFHEERLAALAGQSQSAFSRSFRKHTGMAFVQYVNRLRINVACQMLMSDDHATVTDVCYAAGFNNLSNFNRQFLAQKGMSPSRFRALLAENIQTAHAA